MLAKLELVVTLVYCQKFGLFPGEDCHNFRKVVDKSIKTCSPCGHGNGPNFLTTNKVQNIISYIPGGL